MFLATAKRDTIVAEGAVVGYTTDYRQEDGDIKVPWPDSYRSFVGAPMGRPRHW
jgi:hypothetical protein